MSGHVSNARAGAIIDEGESKNESAPKRKRERREEREKTEDRREETGERRERGPQRERESERKIKVCSFAFWAQAGATGAGCLRKAIIYTVICDRNCRTG